MTWYGGVVVCIAGWGWQWCFCNKKRNIALVKCFCRFQCQIMHKMPMCLQFPYWIQPWPWSWSFSSWEKNLNQANEGGSHQERSTHPWTRFVWSFIHVFVHSFIYSHFSNSKPQTVLMRFKNKKSDFLTQMGNLTNLHFLVFFNVLYTSRFQLNHMHSMKM